MEGKTHTYKVIVYDNFVQYASDEIFFATKKQASNYVEFMKKNDPDSKAGYITYSIEKQVVYLSEYTMIIKYLKEEIYDLKHELAELKLENDNDSYFKYNNQELECERKIKEKEALLKSYQEKLTVKTNDKFYQQNIEIEKYF